MCILVQIRSKILNGTLVWIYLALKCMNTTRYDIHQTKLIKNRWKSIEALVIEFIN